MTEDAEGCLKVRAGGPVDGVKVECRVVRLLDLLRALLVEDLAQGADVPEIISDHVRLFHLQSQ